MKKTILFKLALAFIAVSGWMSANGQTSLSLNWVQDSSFSAYCPTPVQVEYNGSGSATGYNTTTDSIEIQIAFGDGNDTTFMTPIWGTTTQSYWFWAHHVYNLPGSYTIQVIATAPDGLSDTLTYGPVVVSNGCGFIDGFTYIDHNGNCVFDAGDDTLKYVHIKAIDPTTGNTLVQSWSGFNGNYNMTVPSGVNIDLVIDPVSGLTASCPSGGSYSINLTSGGTGTYDFGVSCSTTQYDLASHGIAWGFVPGNESYIYAFANNHSCVSQGGTLTLTLDPNVSFVTAIGSNIPTSVSGNTITWTVPPMTMGNYNSYWGQYLGKIKVLTDTTVVVGDTLCFSTSITPTSGDLNTANNTYNWCLPAVASYDPNEKNVSPLGAGPGGNVHPTNTEFTYTIHFQNTGTYPAEDIYIMDTISNNLDMSTFEILGSSHPQLHPIILGDNIVKFDYQDIWLADSTSNEPASHGFVTYRISAVNGLPHMTQIENTASIYFDYNAPVVTNTTLNTIDFGVGILETLAPSALVYPNPANDFLIVEFEKVHNGVINVVDIAGRTVQSFTMNGTKTQVEISNLAPGIYTLVSEGNAVARVTIQR